MEQPNLPTRFRKTMTASALAANRANAKKVGSKGGRPRGSVNADKVALSERCRVKDMRHVEILEHIAENDPNTGYRLTAISMLGAIPFIVQLQLALCDDDD
jgi:hypothetical protein